jgi:hypothetical protein
MRPVRLAIPDEFLPPRRHPSKQYTFAQTPNRVPPRSETDTSQSRRSTARPGTALADPDANSLRERLSDSPDFSDLTDDELILVITHLKEYVKCVAAGCDYNEARRSQALYDAAMNARYHRVHDRVKSESPRTRLAATQREQEEIWQRELDEFDRETEDKIAQLNARHETEMKEFELRWQEDETLRKYRKPSSRLLQLSRMEKFLARLRCFNEAEVVNLETRELTDRELAMSQAMINRDFHVAKEKLKEKQQREYELLVATQQHWRDCVVVRQNAEKAVLHNRENAVEQRQKEPCRTRESQLPTGRARPISSECGTRFGGSAPISFQYATVLPPVAPPEEIEYQAAQIGQGEGGAGASEGTKEDEEEGVVTEE